MEQELHGKSEEKFVPAVNVEELQNAAAEDSGEMPGSEMEEIKEQAFDDPRVMEATAKVIEARNKGVNEAELVAESRRVYNQVVEELRIAHGGETPEQKEARRQVALSVIAAELPKDASEIEVMKAYGLVDSEGRYSAGTPLFHDSTKTAIDAYLKLVNRFNAASDIERTGLRIKDMQKVNVDRTEAHNMAATMVSRDLHIPFGEARQMVAAIREGMVIDEESSKYRMAVRRETKELEHNGGHFEQVSAVALRYLRELDIRNSKDNGLH